MGLGGHETVAQPPNMILEVALPLPVLKNFDYLLPDEAQGPSVSLVGCRVRVPFGPRSMTGMVVGVKEKTDTPIERLKKILQCLDLDPILDPSMLALGAWMADRYMCSHGEALNVLLPPPPTKKNMEYEGGANLTHDEFEQVSFRESQFSLTTEQDAAVQKIHRAIYEPQAETSRHFLLRGVSAAGKTEVYISAIRDVLAQGKTALYLAPEIGLVAQLADTLKHRFGTSHVCVWHSGRSLKERAEDWEKIRRGDISLVVGARSAVLLPMRNLGLLIVDEEHDSAWKEDHKPRFHVRDVVLERARLEKSVAIFGSATPSLEILFASKTGRVELVEMNERAVQASAPLVRVIDMKSEKVRGILSPSLEKAIGARLAKKEQAILFINRRGFHRSLRCPSCDWVARCPDCGVTQVIHKFPVPLKERSAKEPLAGRSHLVCHYCQKSSAVPTACPSCGHKKLSPRGTGTERVTEEIKEKFPWARVARWDRDSVKKKGEQEKILLDFQNGDLDVLVGTQLVAQGFHFPKVTLVGVVNADTSLHVPDFRAAEHTFQLLMQVAGRAGRDVVAGEVLIQTRHPDHAALVCAAHLDYQRFAEQELKFRQDLFYPPFTHLIKVETTAPDLKKAEDDMGHFQKWLMDLVVEEPIGILGPTLSVRKRKGAISFHAILKVPFQVFDAFRHDLRTYLTSKSSRLRVDIDPG
ncbi:MAG: Primosomal protein N' [Elusimicrobia bacterium]|nr:Primosomal protein N' [Elusimicrobiota bacterium]